MSVTALQIFIELTTFEGDKNRILKGHMINRNLTLVISSY